MFILDFLFFRQDRAKKINIPLWVGVGILIIVGLLMQFSVSGGSLEPWALRHFIRVIIGLCLVLVVVSIDLNFFYKYSWHLYFLVVLSLVLVFIIGSTFKGSQRWLSIAFITFQPSDLIKASIILVLSRYFHTINAEASKAFKHYIIPILVTIIPAFLVLVQPDLGTSILIVLIGAVMIFIAGLQYRYFVGAFVLALLAIPIFWNFVMLDYQKQRVLTLLNPEADPYGKGYQLIQSKISIGSGGFFGVGYLNSSQTRLNFLPEKQTDFIFAVFAEEFGIFGVILLISLYMFILYRCYKLSLECKHTFGKFLTTGFATLLFFHIIVNIAMVSGIFPVVGVPLPLMSFGGSSLITFLLGFALIQNASSTNSI